MRSPRCSTSTIRARRANGRPTPTAATRTTTPSLSSSASTRRSTAEFPGALTIAEESTAFPGVSLPTNLGGLGFGFKWNMGWMHDTLDYISRDPIYRRWSHDKMTFGLLYAFSENFVLPISHDEVVHGKRSLVSKMPGDEWQRFANARAYLGFMWAHPGKKLLFMGQEFGQTSEWNCNERCPGGCSTIRRIRGCKELVRDLNALYRSRPRCTRATARPRASAGSSSTTTASRSSPSCAWAPRAIRRSPSSATSRRRSAREYRIGLPSIGPLDRGAQHRRGDLWRFERRQSRRRHGGAAAAARLPGFRRADPAAAGGALI